jgi:hypothetical protein
VCKVAVLKSVDNIKDAIRITGAFRSVECVGFNRTHTHNHRNSAKVATYFVEEQLSLQSSAKCKYDSYCFVLFIACILL